MTSLFTPFDLNSFLFCGFFIMMSCFLVMNFFYKMNIFNSAFISGLSVLMNFFLSLKPKMFSKFSNVLFFSIFLLVLFTNLLSVFCFNFPVTSQASFILTCALGVWVSLIFFSFFKNFKGIFSHFIPEGTPLMLTILIFLIEIVSNIIRPLTLTVRLVANILAGHLLMSLLSSLVFMLPPIFIFYFILNLAELLVALIQAYIFTTMTVLYFSEV